MKPRSGVSRRTFLKMTGAAPAAVALTADPAGYTDPAVGAPSIGQSSAGAPEVVVVGAGAFGGWTALNLRELGHSVTLVDAHGPGNSRSSSGGETRQIRAGYGDRAIYTRWVLKALQKWQSYQAEWGKTLLLQTGRIFMAPEKTAWLVDTKAVLDKEGVPSEILNHDELVRRYPQMSLDGIGFGLFEPTTGVLKAREGCRAVAEAFERKGGRVTIANVALGRRSGRRLETVTTSSGANLPAQTFVFACGPWLPKVFPELMAKKLFTPRRDVFFFGTPAGDDRFTYPNFPNYSEEESNGYYGFPSIDYRGFKVCPSGERTAFDPETDERIVAAHQVKRARDYVALRFPALKDQPILETRVCQLEMSVDEHFIIDRHPEFDNVWIAGGGSGHGYKHGPVVGEYVANRVTGRATEPGLEAMFALKAGSF